MPKIYQDSTAKTNQNFFNMKVSKKWLKNKMLSKI